MIAPLALAASSLAQPLPAAPISISGMAAIAAQAPAGTADDAEGHELWKLDQLLVQVSYNDPRLKALEPDHSMAAVIAHLNQLGISYTRRSVTIDASALPQKILGDINGLPPTEPFILPEGQATTVNVIVSRRLPGDSAMRAPLSLPAARAAKEA